MIDLTKKQKDFIARARANLQKPVTGPPVDEETLRHFEEKTREPVGMGEPEPRNNKSIMVVVESEEPSMESTVIVVSKDSAAGKKEAAKKSILD